MFYLLDKPVGISSFKAIRDFAKENNIKKVGHTGTLDPMASGLLLIATDDDTKLIDFIDKGKKTYIASLEFNLSSNTLDSDGEVTPYEVNYPKEKVKDVIKSFIKEYDQMPPDFSAKKINGKRAYELARNGEEVSLKPSKIKVFEIKDIVNDGDNKWTFEITVSRGTYIRSIIRDIAEELGTKAIMTYLRRTMVAGFKEDSLNQWLDEKKLINLPLIEIDDMKSLFDGKPIKVEQKDGKYGIIFKDKIIGIINIKNDQIETRRLFGNKYKELLNESN